MKLSRSKWVVLMSVLGAVAVAGPSPFNPPVAGTVMPAFLFLGLVYGWAAGELTWRYALAPAIDPRVSTERKHRILYATLAIALLAIPIGLLAHGIFAGR